MKICWFEQIEIVCRKARAELEKEAPDLVNVAGHTDQIQLLNERIRDKLQDEGVILDERLRQ